MIGRQNVGDNVVEDRARAIFGRDLEPLSFDQHDVLVPCPAGMLKDTQYKDERVQAVNRMMNSAETAQAAHRLRLIHGDEPKELFLLTNEVLPIRVTDSLRLEANITLYDRLLLELRKVLLSDGVAIQVGKHWKQWPECLNRADEQMRRELLDQAVEDAALCTYRIYGFKSRTENRKKRTGLVLGINEESCRERFLEVYPKDKSLELKEASAP